MNNAPLRSSEVQGAKPRVALLEREAYAGPCELTSPSDHLTQAREVNQSEEVVIIRGTITVSP